jgi:hypothetical protein
VCNKNIKSGILVFVFICVGTVFAGDKESDPVLGIVSGKVTNVRSSPSLKGKRLIKCTLGEPVLTFGKSKTKMRIGGDRFYWIKIKTQDHVEGWIYGKYVQVLDDAVKGRAVHLKRFVEREFKEYLFSPNHHFSDLVLSIRTFQKKPYGILSFTWQHDEVTSRGYYVYAMNGDHAKIAETQSGSRHLFYDLDSDGYAEIITLGKKNPTSIYVFSEKSRKSIFGYSLYADGPFQPLDRIYDSHIEVRDIVPRKNCEIVVHIRKKPGASVEKRHYRWDGTTFRWRR